MFARARKTELTICDICGEKAARLVKRPQILGRGEQMLVVDNVPVISCKNCGESYMTSRTMHKLDDIRTKRKNKKTSAKSPSPNLFEDISPNKCAKKNIFKIF